MASSTGPAILAESGDNPTGGGVGDRAEVLTELLRQGATDTIFAGICDRPAVEAAFAAGAGAEIELSIGGSLDPSSTPFEGKVRIVRLADAPDPADRQAVIAIAGVTLVLSARRPALSRHRGFHRAGARSEIGGDPGRQVGLFVAGTGADRQPVADDAVAGRGRSGRGAAAAPAQDQIDLSVRHRLRLDAEGSTLGARPALELFSVSVKH